MNDIVIKRTHIYRELKIWLLALLVAEGVNIYAIIKYKTPWVELFTSIGFVMIFSLIFYLLALIFRLLYKGFARLFMSKA
ncbi:hypothetical protein E9993_11050 [Labilibacter sediminis]|nr:hypothetical protein E9993_11050 [Labilibacter sediminis]